MTIGDERIGHIRDGVGAYDEALRLHAIERQRAMERLQPQSQDPSQVPEQLVPDRLRNDPYFELNAQQLRAVARLAGLAIPRSSTSGRNDKPPKRSDGSKPEPTPSFWARAEAGDRSLSELLEDAGRRHGDNLSDAVDKRWQGTLRGIVRQYRTAFRLRSSSRERASVVDHLDDLAELVPEDHPLRPMLRSAAEQLRAWPTAPA